MELQWKNECHDEFLIAKKQSKKYDFLYCDELN